MYGKIGSLVLSGVSNAGSFVLPYSFRFCLGITAFASTLNGFVAVNGTDLTITRTVAGDTMWGGLTIVRD